MNHVFVHAWRIRGRVVIQFFNRLLDVHKGFCDRSFSQARPLLKLLVGHKSRLDHLLKEVRELLGIYVIPLHNFDIAETGLDVFEQL